MRLGSSGCVRGGQFVIDLSSAKKKGMEEGRRAEKMVSKESSSKVMDFSFLQSKATGFYQRSHLDNPKRPHSATSDFPQSLASWACRGVVGVGGGTGLPGREEQEPCRGPMQPGGFENLRAPHYLAAAPRHPDWSSGLGLWVGAASRGTGGLGARAGPGEQAASRAHNGAVLPAGGRLAWLGNEHIF